MTHSAGQEECRSCRPEEACSPAVAPPWWRRQTPNVYSPKTLPPKSNPSPKSYPQTILQEAEVVTSGDRRKFYGHPRDNHGNTAELWNGWLHRKGLLPQDKNLTFEDVCFMMALLKISRHANLPKRDNLVDIAGYMRNVEQAVEGFDPSVTDVTKS